MPPMNDRRERPARSMLSVIYCPSRGRQANSATLSPVKVGRPNGRLPLGKQITLVRSRI
jgi:hypothetical protein